MSRLMTALQPIQADFVRELAAYFQKRMREKKPPPRA
jgi:hypothetical protein